MRCRIVCSAYWPWLGESDRFALPCRRRPAPRLVSARKQAQFTNHLRISGREAVAPLRLDRGVVCRSGDRRHGQSGGWRYSAGQQHGGLTETLQAEAHRRKAGPMEQAGVADMESGAEVMEPEGCVCRLVLEGVVPVGLVGGNAAGGSTWNRRRSLMGEYSVGG